jgi:fibronectin type 3 domain-containing protein/TolB-like protein
MSSEVAQKFRKLMGVLTYLCLWAFVSSSQAEQQHSVAVFQFSAGSFEAVGLEKALAYSVRNELRKYDGILLTNQRSMEVELNRNEIAQTFDSAQAIMAGQVLGVNYVVLGTVDRLGSQIVANIQLVSSESQTVLGDWTYRYRNEQEISNRAAKLGDEITTKINEHQSSSALAGAANGVIWLDNINASNLDGKIALSWSANQSAPEALGFNVYRSNSESGPFSYITSVIDPFFNDNVEALEGSLYYQIGLLTAEGDEIRSNQLASAELRVQITADIEAPTVVSFTPLLRGIELEFIAAAQNSEKGIDGYQLVRSQAGSPWIQASFMSVAPVGSKKSSSSSVARHVMRDEKTESLTSAVEYAVRAVKGDELGELSELYAYEAVSAPEIQGSDKLKVRQIELNWISASNGDGYRLYRRESEGAWQQIAQLDSITENKFTDTAIDLDGETFEYALSIFDAYAESEKSSVITLASRPELPAPEQVEASGGLAKRVDLRWQAMVDDTDVMGYGIFRTEFSDSNELTLTRVGEVMNRSVSEYSDTHVLQDGTRYVYAVSAINAFDVSGQLSSVVKVSTKDAPQSVTSIEVNPEQDILRLSWSYPDSGNVKHFNIQRRWLNSQWQQLAQLPSSQFSYVDTDLMAEAEVQYKISVVDQDKLQSSPTLSTKVNSPVSLSLNQPKNGLLRKVELNWKPALHVDSLIILRSQEQQSWEVIATLGNDQVSFTDQNNLLDDTVYYYKLQTVYGQNVAAESAVVNARTKNIPAPSALQVSNSQARQITLQWPALVDNSIKSYVIYRHQQNHPAEAAIQIGEVMADLQTEFVNSVSGPFQIEHGMAYLYSIASKNVFDVIGPKSEAIVGTSKALPKKPHSINVSAKSNFIQLNWQTGDETDLQFVQVYRKWEHHTDWVKVVSLNADSKQYQDKNLLPYTHAEYRLELIDSGKLSSGFSDSVKQLSPLTSLLEVKQEGLLRQVTLAWQPNPLVDSYQLQRSTDQLSWQQIAETSQLSFEDDKGLVDQTRYFYRLNVVENNQVLGSSNIVQATTKALPLPPNDISLIVGLVEKVMIKWRPHQDKDVGGYIIYRLDESSDLKELETVKANVGEYQDDGGFFSSLKHGTQYSYAISSFNTYKVEGPKSQIFKGITKSLPRQVSQLEGLFSHDKVVINWQQNPESDIQEYWIYRSRGCGKGRKLATVKATSSQFTDTSVESGNDYCYSVSGVDSDELEGERSEPYQINVPTELGVE